MTTATARQARVRYPIDRRPTPTTSSHSPRLLSLISSDRSTRFRVCWTCRSWMLYTAVSKVLIALITFVDSVCNFLVTFSSTHSDWTSWNAEYNCTQSTANSDTVWPFMPILLKTAIVLRIFFWKKKKCRFKRSKRVICDGHIGTNIENVRFKRYLYLPTYPAIDTLSPRRR